MPDYTTDERDLLRAVRQLVRADREMRTRLSGAMRVNPTDLRSLRHVIRVVEETEGQPCDQPAGVTPRRLADHLGVTTAAVTVLVDRLVASGHLERLPNPRDRRSVLLVPTEMARRELASHLAHMHTRMKQIAAAVPPEARPALVEFLESLTQEMDSGGLDLSPS